jgi:hypothetical protein
MQRTRWKKTYCGCPRIDWICSSILRLSQSSSLGLAIIQTTKGVGATVIAGAMAIVNQVMQSESEKPSNDAL